MYSSRNFFFFLYPIVAYISFLIIFLIFFLFSLLLFISAQLFLLLLSAFYILVAAAFHVFWIFQRFVQDSLFPLVIFRCFFFFCLSFICTFSYFLLQIFFHILFTSFHSLYFYFTLISLLFTSVDKFHDHPWTFLDLIAYLLNHCFKFSCSLSSPILPFLFLTASFNFLLISHFTFFLCYIYFSIFCFRV